MLDAEIFNLLEGTSDAAFTVTGLGEICSWNQGAEKLFEYTAAEALNSTCHKILQGRGALGTELCGENCSVRDCATKRLEIPNFDLEAKARSGRRLWVSVSTLVFENSRNRQRLIVHLAHDITERKKNEELLRKMINVVRQLVAVPDVIANPSPILPLSEQEIEILRCFSIGHNSSAIARKLNITLQTLRNHLHHVNQKLHTHNRLEAVTHAMQRRLL
ncbi:MAG: LuxR C-terminal-related transcriptional regulator [Verrucomicrobiota bacterium]